MMTENWACIKEVDCREHHRGDSCPSEPLWPCHDQEPPGLRRGSDPLHGAGPILHCDATCQQQAMARGSNQSAGPVLLGFPKRTEHPCPENNYEIWKITGIQASF